MIISCILINDVDQYYCALNSIGSVITAIREEHNTDKRIRMLQKLNNSLPKDIRLQLPSLITNAYVRKALDIIEERAALVA
jgi:hypothetical protein